MADNDADDAPQTAAVAASIAAVAGPTATPAPVADVSSITSSAYTLERINDIIDFETELIMLDDRANRNAHFETLRFFWQLYPARNIQTGRRYARFLIAQLLSTACNFQPYTSDRGSGRKKNAQQLQQQQQQLPLDQWTRQDWQRLQDDLEHLREVLIRHDAECNINSDAATIEQQPEADQGDALNAAIAAAKATADRLNVQRAQSPAFSTKYDTIVILLETQKALAPIRFQLEKLVINPKAKQQEETIESVISPEEMHDLFAYATSLAETRASDWLLHLFEPVAAPAVTAVTAESTEQQRHAVLKSNRQELNDLLTSKAFDLVYLQEKLQIVLLRFNGEVYGKQVPVLVKLHYSFEPSCTRHLDRRAKQASNELYKFIVATEQKPRARFTAMRSFTIKKKPPEDVATAAKKAKKTKKNKKDLHEVKKEGRAAKPDPKGVPADSSAECDTTATPTDNAKKGRGTRGSKKHSLSQQPDLLDLFDLDDKDDANEAAKMSQGAAKKPRIVASSGHGGAYSLAVGISAAADDDPNSHWNLPPPDHGIFDPMGKVLRRIKWTDKEKNAVREGVRTLGVGKWMDVKKKYPFVLKNRTSVQIKDCYRTMSKNKEMDAEGVCYRTMSKNKEMDAVGV